MTTEIININATGFIVPNNAIKLNEFFEGSGTKSHIEDFAKLNNILIKDDELIIEMWLYSKELGSDNLSDHGISIGEDIYIRPYTLGRIPVSLLNGKIEGDIINFKAKAIKITDLEEKREKQNVILNITLTLQQSETRYSYFGRFEEVLHNVCK